MSHKISLGKWVDALPANELLYRFCKRYVDHYHGENNPDMHTNGELYWLRQVLPRCEIVFDVGANVGNWTALALSLNPALHIHCFEPSAATFQRLQARAFGSGKVSLNRLGLSASPGETTLHLFGEAAGTNSLYRREGLPIEQTLTEQIQLDTLDAYCQRENVTRIDLLKLDVEGHELRALQGAEHMLSQGKIQQIQFEYGGSYIDARILLKDMFELLSSYGYRLHKICPHRLRSVDRYDQRLENFQYQNWAAIKRD
jgi:FkbM family methyltransferase